MRREKQQIKDENKERERGKQQNEKEQQKYYLLVETKQT
jgi:hypothetical protein